MNQVKRKILVQHMIYQFKRGSTKGIEAIHNEIKSSSFNIHD